jgi:hypothetical protein
VKRAALEYRKAGINVIPICLDGSKAPAVKWARYQTHEQTQQDIATLFSRQCGIAVVCGQISGGLEIIDFDCAETFAPWRELVDHLCSGLADYLTVVRTPNGYHVYYRSDVCEGLQKLAMSRESRGEKAGRVLIETRGEGGYAIAPPSPPQVHASGIQYERISGPSIAGLVKLTPEDRALLLDAARSFNEVAEEPPPFRQTEHNHSAAPGSTERPGDDYNARATWRETLEPSGWEVVRAVGDTLHWRRPGKQDRGLSATTGFCGDKLFVFSSNAQPFEPGRAYSKFSALVRLEFGGDASAASRELRKRGYGKTIASSPQRERRLQEIGRVVSATPEIPTTTITAPEIERLLDEDPNAPFKPDVFARLLATRENITEFAQIEDILRRRRKITTFKAAAKKADAAKSAEKDDRRAEPHVQPRRTDAASLKHSLTCFGDIPIQCDDLRIPDAYEIVDSTIPGSYRLFRVFQKTTKNGTETIRIPVCDHVPIVSAMLTSPGQTEQVECVWPWRGGWLKKAVPWSAINDSAKIGAAFGDLPFPVNSENRREMVRWLDAFRRCNEDLIPNIDVNEVGGYQEKGGFLLGNEYIGGGDESVVYDASGKGESQIADGLAVKRGTMDGWRDAMRHVHGRPKLELALYASLAAPLLRPLGASNFCLEWAGKTSGGKTTALSLAASVWGECRESEPDCLLRSWSATPVGVERYMQAMNDLPCFLDDTQAAEIRQGKRPTLQQVIHNLTGGEKLRGDKSGSRRAIRYRTIVLSTGEEPITELMQGGGAAARALVIWGSPTDGLDHREVHSLRESFAQNCGHAGQEWIEFISKNKEKWSDWRALFEQYREKYLSLMENVKDKGVAGRQASYLAVIGVSAHLAVDALDLPWGSDESDPVEPCIALFAAESAKISRPESALESIASYVGGRMHAVLGSGACDERKPPSSGWIGQVSARTSCLFLYTSQLRIILDELGYQSGSIIRQWRDSGVLIPDNAGNPRSKVRDQISGAVVSAYRIAFATLERAGLDLAPPTHGKSNGSAESADMPTDDLFASH